MIYIAAPFFNEYQVSVVEKIKRLLDDLDYKYFSPKDANPVIDPTPSDSKLNPELKKKIFMNNVDAMKFSSLAIAVIDDFDKGVIWEMGFLYSLGIPIIGYTNFADRGMNLMLEESVIGFVHGINELKDKL